MRDGRAEPRGAEAYLKQYVEGARGEPARLDAGTLHPSWSQRRIGGCSRSVHGLGGLGPRPLQLTVPHRVNPVGGSRRLLAVRDQQNGLFEFLRQ